MTQTSPISPLTIVVPTYNERDRLEEFVSRLCEMFKAQGLAGSLIVVDDNSPDGTGELADRLAERFPLRVIHRAGKLGLGTAVIEGFAAATTPVVGVMDADLSHPPDVVPTMVAALASGADFVIGSRYIPGGGTASWSPMRRFLSRLACRLTWPITPVRDATSGLFVVRREVLRDVRIKAGGFKICLELLVRGHARSVVEVPYVFVGREAGESKMNMREATGYLRQLWDLWRWQRANGEPRPEYRRMAPPSAGL